LNFLLHFLHTLYPTAYDEFLSKNNHTVLPIIAEASISDPVSHVIWLTDSSGIISSAHSLSGSSWSKFNSSPLIVFSEKSSISSSISTEEKDNFFLKFLFQWSLLNSKGTGCKSSKSVLPIFQVNITGLLPTGYFPFNC